MKTLSRLIGEIRNLCGKPPREVIDDDVIYETIYSIQTSLNNDQNLSSLNRLVEQVEFPLTAQTMSLPDTVTDFDTLERVEVMQTGWDYYRPLMMVGLDLLPGQFSPTADALGRGVSAVSINGNPPQLSFDGVPAGATIRVWYKPVYGEPNSLSATLAGVPASFVELVKLRAVAVIRDTLALPALPSIEREIALMERQWKRASTEGPESGLVKKQRYGRHGGSPFGWNGHRFFKNT